MSEAEAADPALVIGGVEIPKGRRTNLELQVARLPTGTWVSLPVAVLRGRRPGPRIWLAAAIHGDELNGVDIVRRVLPLIPIDELCGTVIAAPIVNVFGFLNQDRYLPDRRDLNRAFPGSSRGSLAARLAHLFMTQVVEHCGYGIDLHTGSNHRTNLPQIRADLDDPETRRLTEAFGAPVSLHGTVVKGSLRQVASSRGCPVLLFEGGEPLRFDADVILVGVRGILRVLRELSMIPRSTLPEDEIVSTRIVRESQWVRAPRGGILLLESHLGQVVETRQTLARVTDAFSDREREVRAPFRGVVLGQTVNPLVNRGDAIAHLGRVEAD